MIHFPKSEYHIVRSKPVGQRAVLELLTASSSEPDGMGGSFTRRYENVVISSTETGEIIIDIPVDFRVSSAEAVFDRVANSICVST